MRAEAFTVADLRAAVVEMDAGKQPAISMEEWLGPERYVAFCAAIETLREFVAVSDEYREPQEEEEAEYALSVVAAIAAEQEPPSPSEWLSGH